MKLKNWRKCIWKCCLNSGSHFPGLNMLKKIIHLKVMSDGHFVESSLCPLWGSIPHLQRCKLHWSVDYQVTQRIHRGSSPQLSLEANCIYIPEICRSNIVVYALMVVKYCLILKHLPDYNAHMIFEWCHIGTSWRTCDATPISYAHQQLQRFFQ